MTTPTKATPKARTFDDIKVLCQQLKSGSGLRDTDFTNIEKMYLLTDDSLPSESHIKKTISPDPRNQVRGAARLLASSGPKFSVPYIQDDAGAEEASSKLEKFAQACWEASNRQRKKSTEQEAALQGLLYDETHIIVQSTAEMARFSDDPRLQDAVLECPFIFEVVSAKICYAIWDSLGLKIHFCQRAMKVADVRTRWGSAADAILGERQETDTVTYNEYFDPVIHAVWLEEAADKFLLYAPHGLGCIPIASSLFEGSELFDEGLGQPTRQMFLYTLYKSGLWNRMNLSLTTLYTKIALAATSIQFVLHQSSPDDDVEVDLSKPVGVIKVPATAKGFDQINIQAVDAAVLQALEKAENKGQESTIYNQTLGQPLGSNATYSTTALLNQAGRLPLVIYQTVLSLLIGEAMKIAFKIIKRTGTKAKVKSTTKGQKTYAVLEVGPDDIPDGIQVDCTLDISQPQDDRANAQLAQALVSGDTPLTSVRWAREKVLDAGQSDDMTEEIWTEKTEQGLYQLFMQQALPQLVQSMVGQQQGQQQGQNPGQQSGQDQGQGMQQGVTPDMSQQMQQQPGMGTQPAQSGMPQSAPGPMATPNGAQPADMSGLLGGMNGQQ